MSTAVALLLLLVPIQGRGNDVAVAHLDGSSRVSLTGGLGGASQPVWSPDGSKVAFVSTLGADGTRVYVVAPDGTGLHAVTPAGWTVVDPTWSPDAAELAFRRQTAAGFDIWTVRADGSALRRLTSDGGQKMSLAWSPTGLTLLYVKAPGIYLLDPITGGARELVEGGLVPPAWSPGGRSIAYSDLQGQLAVVDPNSGESRVLDGGALSSVPAWSRDGTAIAYSTQQVFPETSSRFSPPVTISDVGAVDVGTGRSRRLTGPLDKGTALVAQLSSSFAPTWWPDSSRLFFLRGGSPPTVWQMNADGSCEQPYAPFADAVATPEWQPGAPPTGNTLACVDLRARFYSTPGPVALRASALLGVVVENDGNLPASNVRVEISATHGATSGLFLTPCTGPVCDLGTLQGGASITFLASVGRVKKAAIVGATLRASSSEPDATPADATATAVLDVVNCTIVGTYGADVLAGTPGNDRICGFPGADRINGGRGNDYIDAGNGDDTIVGGPGRDTIVARGGNDVIYARDGQLDWIDCGTESDIAMVDRIDHTSHCEKVLRR